MSTEPHESNPGHPPAASPAWVDFPGAPSSFAAGRPDAGSRNPNSPNPKGPRDWEGLIGGKWALWVGAFSLFLSVACFLGYTWNAVWSHLPPPTPSEKTAMGFAGGLALMVLGGLLRNRTQRWYGEGLTGAGLGIAYLSLWAGAEYFRILGFMPAFGAMTGLTALGVVLASGYRALSLSLLSTTLGFLTPMLLEGSGARGSALGFLGYIALLDAGVLAVSLLRGWRSLTGLSFVLTVISVGSWANATDLTSIRLLTWGFLTLYAVSFVAAALFGSLGRKEATDSVDLLLFISAGTLYIVAGQAVLAPLFLPFPGIFLLGLALAFAQLSLWINLGAPGNRILLFAAEGLALLALTIAVPVQLREPGVLAIAWVLEAMVLVLAGRRFGSALIRIAGRLVWLLSLLAVGFSWILAHCGDGYILPRTVLAPHLLFLNNGALPLLVAVITAYILAVSGWEKGTGPAATDSFGSLYAAYGTLGGAWLVAQETALGCQWGHYPAASTEGTGAVFLGSALVCVYALAVFVPAARIRHWGLCRLASWVALAGACIPLWAALGGAIPGGHPFWNLRFASVLVVTLVLAALDRARRTAGMATPSGEFLHEAWPALSTAFPLAGFSLELGYALSHGSPAVDWGPNSGYGIAAFVAMAAPQVAILGRRSDDLAVRVVGYLATCTSALIWICAAWTNGPSGTPGANLPFFAGLATAFGCAWTARVTLRRGSGFHEEEAALAPAFVFAATGLALWDLSAQSRYAFWMHRAAIGPHWEVLSGFGLALLWTAFAAGLLWWGCAKQEIVSRFLAYGIFPAGAGILLVAANADVPLWRPVDNPRFACFLAVSLLWSLGVKVLSSRAELTPGERTFPLFGAAGVAGLLLAGASQELFEGCRWYAHGIGPYWGNAAWDWIAILWQGAALAIFLAGLRRNDMALRYAAYYLGAASILVLLTDSLGASELGWTPVLNVRFLAFLVAANALGGVARLIQRHARELGGSGHDETWLLLPVTLLALVILGWGLTQEAYEWAFTCRVLLGDHWERAAETGISGVWSAYGAILLLAGVLRPNRPQRLLALGLLCATVVKVFLFDLAFLDGPLRILALGGLGVSLLFISWLYSRFGVENRRGMAGLDGWPEVPN